MSIRFTCPADHLSLTGNNYVDRVINDIEAADLISLLDVSVFVSPDESLLTAVDLNGWPLPLDLVDKVCGVGTVEGIMSRTRRLM